MGAVCVGQSTDIKPIPSTSHIKNSRSAIIHVEPRNIEQSTRLHTFVKEKVQIRISTNQTMMLATQGAELAPKRVSVAVITRDPEPHSISSDVTHVISAMDSSKSTISPDSRKQHRSTSPFFVSYQKLRESHVVSDILARIDLDDSLEDPSFVITYPSSIEVLSRLGLINENNKVHSAFRQTIQETKYQRSYKIL